MPTGFGTLANQNFSATGFCAFLNFSIPVNEGSAIIVDGGLYYFSANDNHIAIAPVLGGYRLLLGDQDFGFYVEPLLGYTFGGTDIQKYNELGNPL